MALPNDLVEHIVQAGEDLWKRHRQQRGGAFHGFVPADYHGAHEALVRLRNGAGSFVELGSGAGVITVFADLLGYEAVGIEFEPWLVEAARDLAERVGSDAQFVEGSFLPHGWQARADSEFAVTYDGAASAWDDLGFDLVDFDLVYAFPWPGEEEMFFDLVREFGRPGSTFLTYGATDGFVAHPI